MEDVPGTRGYENVVERFIEVSQTVDFEEANKHFLELIFDLADQPSLLPNKRNVTWTHMVFGKS